MKKRDEVLDFWFGDPPRPRSQFWFGKSEEADRVIRDRFLDSVKKAAEGGFDGWAEDPRGRLALIILLDQFPRNIWRDEAEAYLYDGLAVQLVLDGLQRDHDRALDPLERAFFYMPLEHAEDMRLQDLSTKCFAGLLVEAGDGSREVFTGFLDYAEQHRQIIRRFGRFPHRNKVLGRRSTQAEEAFLCQPGSSF
jgi:uncharacterized protein (DUF924 family)